MSLRALVLPAKLFVVAALFFVIYQMIDFAQLFSTLASANVFLVAVSFALLLARLPFMGLRWRLILGEQKYDLATAYLTKLSLVSMFFSIFLPTASGGDVVRGAYLTQRRVTVRDAIVSVFADRFAGVVVLVAIAIPPAVILGVWWPQYWPLSGVVLLVAVLAGGSALVLWALGRVESKGGRSSSAWWGRAMHGLCDTASEMVALARRPPLVFKVLALTLVLQAIGIVSVYLVGEALGAEVGFVFYAMLVPVIWLVTMLPVSIGGLGLREGAFVALFTQVGMTPELALAVSLLVFALALGQSILGGIIFAIDRLGSTATREERSCP